VFLILFTAVWGGGSMIGIYGSQIKSGHFDVSKSPLSLPFLIGTIVLCSITAFLLFGRWEIKLRRGEGIVFTGVGQLGWRRRFTFGPADVFLWRCRVSGSTTNGRKPSLFSKTARR